MTADGEVLLSGHSYLLKYFFWPLELISSWINEWSGGLSSRHAVFYCAKFLGSNPIWYNTLCDQIFLFSESGCCFSSTNVCLFVPRDMRHIPSAPMNKISQKKIVLTCLLSELYWFSKFTDISQEKLYQGWTTTGMYYRCTRHRDRP